METNMKRWLTNLGAALLLALPAGQALAVGPMMDWDPAYFYFPAPQPAGLSPSNQPAGAIMRCVGQISLFGPPLDFLNANLATKEYTFFIGDLTSLGTTTVANGSLEAYVTNYSGGTFTLYEDAAMNSVFAPNPENGQVPATFVDGSAPLLIGTFTGLTVTTNNFTQFKVGSIEGNIQWTGGTLIGELTGGGNEPCPGLFTGGATWNTAPNIGIPGYMFRHDGKLDLQCPTSARKSTWGKLKTLYR
jgi:hypothetical protein